MSKSESGREKRPNELSGTAYEYTTCSPNKGSGKHNIDADAVQEVYDALDVDGIEYCYSKRIADKTDLSRTRAGQALAALADDPDCPLAVERWSAPNTTPAVWRVEVGR